MINEADYWSVKYTEAEVDREAADVRFVQSFNPKLSRDGNQFCLLIGKDIQEGVAGFGSTLAEAYQKLNEAIRWGRV